MALPNGSSLAVWRGVHTRLGLKKGRTNVKHRALLVAAALVGATTLIVSLSVAAAGTGPAKQTSPARTSVPAPPKVPNAAAIRAKYHGQKITFVGDSVGNGHVRDVALAKRFTKDTGIKISVVPHPAASDASYAQLARAFSSKSSSIDVAMLDVNWPGAFAPYLLNLKPKLGKQAKLHIKSIVANGTVGGKLVSMPWFSDYGILYYRTDLLKKYNYKAPPKTWNDLFKMAKKIQDGERSSNANFTGFVFQGNAYEGLTCDALAWLASAGGGHYVDGGKISIDNPKARTILDAMSKQIGKITPRGVTSYQEDETEHAFDNGD